jgi:hypothetical protein
LYSFSLSAPNYAGCLGGNVSTQCNANDGFSPTSTLCGECAAKNVRVLDECILCPNIFWGYVVLALLVMLLLLYFWLPIQEERRPGGGGFKLWPKSRRLTAIKSAEHREAVVKIFTTFLVTLLSINDCKARGPAALRKVLAWLRPFSGGISMAFYPIKCTFGLTLYGHIFGTALLPLTLIAVVGIFLRVLKRHLKALDFFVQFRSDVIIILYFMFPSILEATLPGVFLHHISAMNALII